jgi:hypothetical protein
MINNWMGSAGYSTNPQQLEMSTANGRTQYATCKKIRQSISNYRKKLLISKADADLTEIRGVQADANHMT